MIAGAKRVVATQWPVGDRATALLMLRFYKNLAQTTDPSAAGATNDALFEAKQWLRSLSNEEAIRLLGEFQDSPRGNTEFVFVEGEAQPFQHPFYWAGFSLFGAL